MRIRMDPRAWSWDDLRLFLAATRRRSLSGAARDLRVNQSTATRRLRALEAGLGVRLFDRLSSGLTPTPLAREVFPLAEDAERAVLAFAAKVAGADVSLTGNVRVAVPDGIDSILLTPRLDAFYRTNPLLRLELVASPGLANLARREADLALRFVRPVAGDLVTRRIAVMRLGVWGTKRVAKAGLSRARWIGWDEGSGGPDELRWTAKHVAAERVVLRTNRIDARLAAVRAGLGLAVLPDVVGALERGLVRVPTSEPLSPLEVWLVSHRELLDTPRIRAAWDFLDEVGHEHLAG